MDEPTIVCPNCRTEIKLIESLAAPVLEATRRDFEKRLKQKDTDLVATLKEEAAKIAIEGTLGDTKTIFQPDLIVAFLVVCTLRIPSAITC